MEVVNAEKKWTRVASEMGYNVGNKSTSAGHIGALLKAGFIFGHFVFLCTTPHLGKVADNHRYSRLFSDFLSVGVGNISNGFFLIE